jgi:hypothetical protein
VSSKGDYKANSEKETLQHTPLGSHFPPPPHVIKNGKPVAMTSKVVAVAKRLLSCAPLHKTADPFSRNAKDTLKVRPPLAGKRAVIWQQQVLQPLQGVPNSGSR